jgi:hypothetical protein
MSGLRDVIIQHNVEHIMYADDIQLFISTTPPNLPQAIGQLEECIASVHIWLSKMRLTLNERKTEFIILGTQRALKQCHCQGIHVGTTLIKPSEQVRSLGVVFDPTLTMHPQVTRIRAASFSRLRLIARVAKSLRRHESTLLIKSLVLSNLYYCTPLLAGISSHSLSQLQQVINASARLVNGKKKYDSISDILLHDRWLPMNIIIKLRVLLLLFSVVKHGKPSFLRSSIKPYQPARHLRSENHLLLAIPRTRRCISDYAFRVIGPKLWNSLPFHIRESNTRTSFTDACTDFLLSVSDA